jgi:hypothetical protein
MDFISNALARGLNVDEILLDFAKAFDLVPHGRLAHKLKGYGVDDGILRWIGAFLADRRQRVVLGGEFSSWVDVLSGVPQGSVLGPLLFVVYINDMPDGLLNISKLFADDSKILAIVEDRFSSERLQGDLDKVCEWARDWRMRLNVGKCKVIHYGKDNGRIKYFMDDGCGNRVGLESSGIERDLGVHFSSDLSWDKHIGMVVAKANRMLGMLRKTFVSRDLRLWGNLYVSLVRPHLEYAVQVWNPTHRKNIEVLEKVQRRATRLPVGLRTLRYEERLSRMGLTTLEERRVRGDLIQMFKVAKCIEDVGWVVPPLFRRDGSVCGLAGYLRGHGFCYSRESFPSRVRNGCARAVSIRHDFFLNRLAPIWNGLPSSAVDAPSLNVFKERLAEL